MNAYKKKRRRPAMKDVDESPAAVEERRKSQSGPGAPGVDPEPPHTDEQGGDGRPESIADEPTAPYPAP